MDNISEMKKTAFIRAVDSLVGLYHEADKESTIQRTETVEEAVENFVELSMLSAGVTEGDLVIYAKAQNHFAKMAMVENPRALEHHVEEPPAQPEPVEPPPEEDVKQEQGSA